MPVFERVGEVIKTRDYSVFKKMPGNRKINEAHVMHLMESMNRKQLLVPILCNEYLEVIDGQHRLESIRRLSLPVYYIVVEGYRLEEVHMLNAISRTYKMEDFMNGYIELGNEEYKKFRTFKENYPFLTMQLALLYLSGGRRESVLQPFKEGTFKIADYAQACLWAVRTYAFKEYNMEVLSNRNFNMAILKFYRHQNYDHTRMLNKLSQLGSSFKLQPKMKMYVEMLCEIYNYRSRKQDEIYPHEVLRL
jgi:hypothetical protein